MVAAQKLREVHQSSGSSRTGVCLAIGDGANDVSMIQTASVGVGLTGKEGTQAALAADYVVRRFSHLRRLLFVHGRYSYIRNSRLVLFSFFKNFAYSMPLVWFAFSSRFSGVALYDGLLMTCFNMLWTALPPTLVGCFEADISQHALMRFPVAYDAFKKQPPFSVRKFGLWMLRTFYTGIVLFLVPYALWSGSSVLESNGQTTGLSSFGESIDTSTIVFVNLIMFAESSWWTVPTIIAPFLGIGGFLAVFSLYSSLADYAPYMYGVAQTLLGSVTFWLSLGLQAALLMLPSAAYHSQMREYRASVSDVLAECFRPEVAHLSLEQLCKKFRNQRTFRSSRRSMDSVAHIPAAPQQPVAPDAQSSS